MKINTDSVLNVILAFIIVGTFISCGMCLFSVVFMHYYELFTNRPHSAVSRSGKILIAVYVIIFAVTGWLIYGK